MDKELSKRIQRMFADLNSQSAAGSFPPPGTLADLLSKHVDPSSPPKKTIATTKKMLTCFATAAVEMWLRAVHSFLISASLSKASPIWASVGGYYSSHYSVRAFAHLLGAFQLHKKHLIAYLENGGGHLVLDSKKPAGEHKFYWKYVSERLNDPFFYPNYEDRADGGHRNKANYWDHICRYPVFQPLDAEFLRNAVERISGIELTSIPTPNADADHFPDLEDVQVIAYHRLVRFRRFLDEVCGENRFWKVHRNPTWRPDFMTFSVVEPAFVAVYAKKP